MRPILLVLLVTVATADTFVPDIKALWHFREMIKCTIPSSNPIQDYNDYGCFCGFGGRGTPLDALDKCCEVHDDCYRQAKKYPCKNPYVEMYSHTCNGREVTCTEENRDCKKIICNCDRDAAICFSKAGYNPEYKNVDKKKHCSLESLRTGTLMGRFLPNPNFRNAEPAQ